MSINLSKSSYVLGIDLGTSTTIASVFTKGKSRILKIDGNDYRTISSTTDSDSGDAVSEGAELPETVIKNQASLVTMKKRGRIGDSALSGSGFYVDSEVGGATATGLGEDLMKGCISYEIVRLMKEGKHPQEACDIAVSQLDRELKRRRGKAGDLSLVALNNKGEWGVATNIEGFSFSVATKDEAPTVYISKVIDGKTIHEVASQEWLDAYAKRIKAPIDID